MARSKASATAHQSQRGEFRPAAGYSAAVARWDGARKATAARSASSMCAPAPAELSIVGTLSGRVQVGRLRRRALVLRAAEAMRPIGSTSPMRTSLPVPRAPASGGSLPSTGRWTRLPASNGLNRRRPEPPGGVPPSRRLGTLRRSAAASFCDASTSAPASARRCTPTAPALCPQARMLTRRVPPV